MTLKRLLVIGGTGFIGRHVCRMAAEAGYSVTSLSLGPARMEIPEARHLCADLSDPSSLGEVLAGKGFEYVVNSGGYIDHRPFRDGGRSLIHSHFDGTLNLIELLDRGRLVSFVQLGSSDEYGAAPAPQREDAREAAVSPYSLAKVATTHFLQMLWRTEKFPAVTLRLFLTYGPGQDTRRFLPQLIRGCLEDKKFPVSEGRQIRDFCYVGDVVRGILRALEAPAACGEVINLASGTPVSIKSMIDQVRQLIGKGEPEYGRIPYRVGENPELYADIAKARSLLKWQPHVSLATGLRDTIEFYRGSDNA